MKNLKDILNNAILEKLKVDDIKISDIDFDDMQSNRWIFYDSLEYLDIEDKEEAEQAEMDDADYTQEMIERLNSAYDGFITVDGMTLSDAFSKSEKVISKTVEYNSDLEKIYDMYVRNADVSGMRIFIEDGRLVFEYIISGVKRPRKYIYALTKQGVDIVEDKEENFSDAINWLRPSMIEPIILKK